jgi:hypothetical protein
MNRALVDDTLRSKLGEFQTQTELYDKDGHVVGVITPPPANDATLYDYIAAQTSDEELERRKKEPDGKTTAEVLEYLAAMGAEQ